VGRLDKFGFLFAILLLLNTVSSAAKSQDRNAPEAVYLYWQQGLDKRQLKRKNYLAFTISRYKEFLAWSKAQKIPQTELVPLSKIYTSGVPILLRKQDLIKNLTKFEQSRTKS